jgi:geranylgeranyl diphosphate synthase type II
MNLKEYLATNRKRIDDALEILMPPPTGPFGEHVAAMRYSLFAGGKRLRPLLCLAAAESVAKAPHQAYDSAIEVACVLEMIHTYSLIHDDLPAMDDDDLRRGQPTSHKMFGEAAAILAGDGLLSYGFELLARPHAHLDPKRQLRIIELIGHASGPFGMVGGQSLDISAENEDVSYEQLRTIHRAKTGALIETALQTGAICAGATDVQERALSSYGAHLGLAFQITDDLLDATSTSEQLGKGAGKDDERGKATYPRFFGIEETRHKARASVDKAIAKLKEFDARAEPLRSIAEYVYTRTN